MKKVIKYKNTKNVENSSENSFENSENVENDTENVENNLKIVPEKGASNNEKEATKVSKKMKVKTVKTDKIMDENKTDKTVTLVDDDTEKMLGARKKTDIKSVKSVKTMKKKPKMKLEFVSVEDVNTTESDNLVNRVGPTLSTPNLLTPKLLIPHVEPKLNSELDVAIGPKSCDFDNSNPLVMDFGVKLIPKPTHVGLMVYSDQNTDRFGEAQNKVNIAGRTDELDNDDNNLLLPYAEPKMVDPVVDLLGPANNLQCPLLMEFEDRNKYDRMNPPSAKLAKLGQKLVFCERNLK